MKPSTYLLFFLVTSLGVRYGYFSGTLVLSLILHYPGHLKGLVTRNFCFRVEGGGVVGKVQEKTFKKYDMKKVDVLSVMTEIKTNALDRYLGKFLLCGITIISGVTGSP